MASTPVISGPNSAQSVASGSTIDPFSSVTVTDATANAQDAAIIQLASGATASGSYNGGSLTGPNLVNEGNGSYGIAATDPTTLTTDLQKVVFTPTALPNGTASVSTSMTVAATDTSSGLQGKYSTTVAETSPPLTSQQTYVTALYEGLLGRTPTSSEVQSWTNVINAGTPETTLPADFMGSGEYQQDSQGQFVASLYEGFLGRAPAPTETLGWTTALSYGVSEAQIAASFDDSTEAHMRFGAQISGEDSNSAFVTILYEGLLDRTPSSAEVQSWANVLNGGQSQANVAQDFLGSSEYQSISNNQFVETLYSGMLGRTAGPTEVLGWTEFLNGGATRPQLAGVIAQSAEAQAHWQHVILPTT